AVGEPTGKPWGGLLGRIGGTRRDPEGSGPQDRSEPTSSGTLYATKALRKFLATLTSRPNPVLLDLGPVIGANVSYFGEQLGCKIFVEDLYADIDRHDREGQRRDLGAHIDRRGREGKGGDLAGFFAKRFPQADVSVDGILCWDLLDFLEPPVA